jgi:hypothetical protein
MSYVFLGSTLFGSFFWGGVTPGGLKKFTDPMSFLRDLGPLRLAQSWPGGRGCKGFRTNDPQILLG